MSDPVLQIPFAGGPNETLDPRQAPPGTVLSAVNQVYDADGSYQPRFGVVGLSAGTMRSVRRVAVFQNELLGVDQTGELWAYDSVAKAWIDRDGAPPIAVTHAPLFNTSTSFQSQALAASSGRRVVAWVDTLDSQVRASVYDVATGAIVLGPTNLIPLLPMVNVRLGMIGTVAVMVAATSSPTYQLFAWTIDLSQAVPAWSAGSVVSDANYTSTNGAFGFCVESDRFVLAYQAASTAAVELRTYGTNLVLMTAQNVTTTGYSGMTCIALGYNVAGASTALWLAFVGSTMAVADPAVFLVHYQTLATIGGPYHFTGGPGVTGYTRLEWGPVSGTTMMLVGDTSQSAIWYQQFSNVGPGPIGSTGVGRHLGMAAAPAFDASGARLLMVARTVTNLIAGTPLYQGSFFVVELPLDTTTATVPSLWATVAPRIAAGKNDSSGATSMVATPPLVARTDGSLEVVLPVSRGQNRSGMDLLRVLGPNAPANHQWTAAQLGRELYLGSNVFDGNRMSEVGFAYQPVIQSITGGSGSGSIWEYRATYLRVDAQGNMEEGDPSQPLQVNASAFPGGGFTVNVLPLSLTRKQRYADGILANQASQVFICLYRTQTLASGDTHHYLVAALPLPSGNQNLLTSASIAIVDAAADATIASNAVLYVDSGELPHNIPETLTHIVSHKNRIWGIGADQRTIWYSQIYADGALPGWNELQTLSVDDAGEPLLALASLYDRLVVFTATRIYVVYGDGPSVAGTGNDLTQPQRVPSPCGCIEPRSVVNTPMGIMFQSARGIELLGQDLSVTQVGLPVTTTTATYPICTAATFCPNTSLVRFAMTTDETVPPTGTGMVVCYDVRRQRWANHQITRYRGAGSNGAPLEGAAYHPTLGYCLGVNLGTPDGTANPVAREKTIADAAPWLDYAGAFYGMTIQMAWINNGGLQGWQRVRRVLALAQYYDPHGLTVTLDYDYVATGEQHMWSDVQIAALVSGDVEQVKSTPGQGQCEAIRVTLQTTAPFTLPMVTGRGAGLTGVAFEVRPKAGRARNISAGAST